MREAEAHQEAGDRTLTKGLAPFWIARRQRQARPPWQDPARNWASRGLAAITYLADSREEFSVDDLFDLGLPLPEFPDRTSGLFRAAHVAGLIRPMGYRMSSDTSASGSVQRTWVGVQ